MSIVGPAKYDFADSNSPTFLDVYRVYPDPKLNPVYLQYT